MTLFGSSPEPEENSAVLGGGAKVGIHVGFKPNTCELKKAFSQKPSDLETLYSTLPSLEAQGFALRPSGGFCFDDLGHLTVINRKKATEAGQLRWPRPLEPETTDHP